MPKRRPQQVSRQKADAIPAVGPALHQAGLAAAIFLAPLLWGRFDALGGAIVLGCLCVSAIGLLLSRPSGILPPGVPLSSFHLALAALLGISVISYFPSSSRYASLSEILRLLTGAIVLVLALWAGVESSEFRVQSLSGRGEHKLSPLNSHLSTHHPLPAASFLFLVAAGCFLFDWSLYSQGQLAVLAALIFAAVVWLTLQLSRKGRVYLLQPALASAGVVAAYGVYDWLFMRYAAANPSWQTFSTFYNPNPLAGFLGMALFLSLAACIGSALMGRSGAKGWLFSALVCVAILACLPATYSKGAWLSIYVVGAVFLVLLGWIMLRSYQRRALFAVAVVLVMFVIPAGLVASRPGLRAKASASLGLQNRSNMFRYLTWKGAAKMAADNPLLGVGAGAFEYEFGRYAIAGYTRRAHQNYLEMAAETGWAGGLCFVWLMAAAVVGLGRAVRRAPDRAEKVISISALCAVLVMIFHSFLDYDWFIGANMLYFFIACGVGIRATPGSAVPAPAKSRRRTAFSVAAAVVLALATGEAALLGYADQQFRKAEDAAAANQVWEARDHLRNAAEAAPSFARAYWRLAGMSSPQEGIALAQKAISLEPTYSPYHATLARLKEESRDLPGALAAYQKAGDLNPQNLQAWTGLADVNLRLGRPQGALQAFRRIISVQRSPAGAYQAIEYEVKTEYAEAHYGVGVGILKELAGEEQETALQHFQEALRILDDYDKVGKELEQQRRALGMGNPEKEQELAALRAKCYFRMAQTLRSEGHDAEAARLTAQATQQDAEVANLIAAEDLEWGR